MIGRREQNRLEQRSRILDSAFRLFAEHGFDQVTVSDVAKAARVARATVFNHFASKQGLVEAITAEVLGFYQGMLDNALGQPEIAVPVLLRALFDQMAAGIENTRLFQRGVFREIAKLQLGFDEGGLAQGVNDENQARLVKLLARGQERGELSRSFDPEALASVYSMLANSTITGWLYEQAQASLRERMQTVVEIFLGSVALDPEADRKTPLPDLNPARLWEW